jgi:hypothetical protein
LNTGGKEITAKKIVATIVCVLNRKVEPISMKRCNEEVTNNQKHQAFQGKTDNSLEDNENKCSSTFGELNSHKEQDIHQESGGLNISDTGNKKAPKRPRRQPITRNNNFLWTKNNRKDLGDSL